MPRVTTQPAAENTPGSGAGQARVERRVFWSTRCLGPCVSSGTFRGFRRSLSTSLYLGVVTKRAGRPCSLGPGDKRPPWGRSRLLPQASPVPSAAAGPCLTWPNPTSHRRLAPRPRAQLRQIHPGQERPTAPTREQGRGCLLLKRRNVAPQASHGAPQARSGQAEEAEPSPARSRLRVTGS